MYFPIFGICSYLFASHCGWHQKKKYKEVLGGDIIKGILAEGRSPTLIPIGQGTAATGRPHIGYVVPLTKIADFLRAGVEAKILLADVHAFLDNLKAPLDLVTHRTIYYEFVLRAIFTSLGIPTSTLTFVRGSDYQLSREYNLDNYKLCTLATEHDAKKARSEVVKVDRWHKIFTYAELYLPRLGYAKRAHLMNTMVPGLMGGEMSSSDPDSKIYILDPSEVVKRKTKKAFCEGRQCGHVTRDRRIQWGGGPSHYQELEDDFAAKKIHPGDLKEWQQVEQLAYPDPNAKEVKMKKKTREGVPVTSEEKVRTPPNPHLRRSMVLLTKDGYLIHLLVSLMARQYQHDERVS
ncbi:hypothetical protein L210DRAFT_3623018 [Boletus edulis BED1]|uniref:tyrosine--tRNA ligase n=1 Tax=Boletus edulis BED1 TaxID=1328754 RepID=A0AAD4BLW7_BOLED|nr:hypothetical protein L210DRAFT_3623018 [Boletus edulis BED1]